MITLENNLKQEYIYDVVQLDSETYVVKSSVATTPFVHYVALKVISKGKGYTSEGYYSFHRVEGVGLLGELIGKRSAALENLPPGSRERIAAATRFRNACYAEEKVLIEQAFASDFAAL